MNSLQDALTEALEHPKEEHKHHSNKPHRSRRVVIVSKENEGDGARAFLWGAVGSFIGAALVYRAPLKCFFSRS